MVTQHHKTKNEENFPVGSFLIKKKYRRVVFDYYDFARYADDIADDYKLKPESKLKELDNLENILIGAKKSKSAKMQFVLKLKKDFVEHNLSNSLATDLLVAFRKDAENIEYKTWNQLIDYCRYSAAPVGRFMLALHDESPSTFLPATSLCVALQVLNHLQDLKKDVENLNRIYLPTEMLKKFKVTKNDLTKDKTSPNLEKLIIEILSRVKGLQKEAEILPQIVKNFGLRAEICVILSLTNFMVKRLYKDDVLAKNIKFSKLDWILATINGIRKAIFTKTKTLTTKGF